MKIKAALIGAGAMGEAILQGLLKSGFIEGQDIVASDVSEERRNYIAENTGVKVTDNNIEAIEGARVIILAVKPQNIFQVIDEMSWAIEPSQLIMSIAPGISTAAIEERLKEDVAVARVMPNTPSLIGEGISALCFGRCVSGEDEELAEAVMASVGKVVKVPEKLMNAITGLSGSGPAYAYIMIEALSDAGVKMGLPRATATLLAAQTLYGSAKMVLETQRHPGELKDMVTSPGGTTIWGVHELEKGGLRAILMSAVEAATYRSEELGRKE
jgi:pyrroline-5-carboxylate reductase